MSSSKTVAYIGRVDLGNVENIMPTTTKKVDNFEIAGEIGSYPRDLVSYRRHWRITGYLYSPTSAELEEFLSLDNGEVYLMEVNAFNLFAYGKVTNISIQVDNQWASLYRYNLDFEGCPAIGATHSRTSGVYFHDRSYRKTVKDFDPHFRRYNLAYTANRLDLDYDFYLDNDNAAQQMLALKLKQAIIYQL